jgi:hypothetical protein
MGGRRKGRMQKGANFNKESRKVGREFFLPSCFPY